jgi:four helix bundle protein
MSKTAYVPIEEMELFQRYVSVADWAWEIVGTWSLLAADTVGKQLIRALDSIGANLVEGDGRHTDPDATHFFVIARASAREGRYWLQRAIRRKLISAEEGNKQIGVLTSATQLLNNLIAYRRRSARTNRVREARASYSVAPSDPFIAE